MPEQPFVYVRRVAFAETDMAGIMHFANFYRYMEEAEHALFRSAGLKLMLDQPDGTVIGWPRVTASCSFESPARYDDEIAISVWIERMGVKSVTFYCEFHRDAERLAYGRMKTACCLCGADGKLTSIPVPPPYAELLVETPGCPSLKVDGKPRH